jgi:hypothetical protein
MEHHARCLRSRVDSSVRIAGPVIPSSSASPGVENQEEALFQASPA